MGEGKRQEGEKAEDPTGITRSQDPPGIALGDVCQTHLWLEGAVWQGFICEKQKLLSVPCWALLPVWGPPEVSYVPSDRISSNFLNEDGSSLWPWAAVMSSLACITTTCLQWEIKACDEPLRHEGCLLLHYNLVPKHTQRWNRSRWEEVLAPSLQPPSLLRWHKSTVRQGLLWNHSEACECEPLPRSSSASCPLRSQNWDCVKVQKLWERDEVTSCPHWEGILLFICHWWREY